MLPPVGAFGGLPPAWAGGNGRRDVLGLCLRRGCRDGLPLAWAAPLGVTGCRCGGRSVPLGRGLGRPGSVVIGGAEKGRAAFEAARLWSSWGGGDDAGMLGRDARRLMGLAAWARVAFGGPAGARSVARGPGGHGCTLAGLMLADWRRVGAKNPPRGGWGCYSGSPASRRSMMAMAVDRLEAA